MKLEPPWDRRRRPDFDNQTLPLINVAFLLLVFFLMAGTLMPPDPFSVDRVQVDEGESSKPLLNILSVAADGRLAYRGELIEQAQLTTALFAELDGPLPVKVDAGTPARSVIALLRRLKTAGVASVKLIGVKPESP